MKYFLTAYSVMLMFSSCDQKPKNPVSEYGNAMIDSYQKGQRAGATANLQAIKSSIQVYYASNGKFPQNLEDLDFYGQQIDFS